MKHVITVSRQYGSGGREIGLMLSEKLGIPFYDKELISMASEEANISEDVFREHDEIVSQNNEHSRYSTLSPIYEIPVSDQLFVVQSKVIKQLASKGPCVIVGRCADMVLEDSINLFIFANIKDRIERIIASERGNVDASQLETTVRQVDRKRKEYYQYYTGNTWGKAQNYDLCLNSGKAGVEGCVNAVLSYLEAIE